MSFTEAKIEADRVGQLLTPAASRAFLEQKLIVIN